MTFSRAFLLVRRHWRVFAVVAAAAALVSIVFSGPSFIKPRYRSEAVVYPVNLNSYSIETRADQLLQLLQSNSIRDSIVKNFGLVAHYRLDTVAKGGRNSLYNLYKERVGIEKTRYESVDITVTDEDPVMARDMVESILHQTDLLARRLQRRNSAELLVITRQALKRTKERMDSVEQRLDELRTTYGLLDYSAQAKELTKGYMKVIANHGSEAQRKEVAGMLANLAARGGEFRDLSTLDGILVQEYGKQRSEERQLIMDVNKVLTYTNTVVYPEVADKKVYPVRWLIVLASLVAACLLCYVLVFFREQGKGPAAP